MLDYSIEDIDTTLDKLLALRIDWETKRETITIGQFQVQGATPAVTEDTVQLYNGVYKAFLQLCDATAEFFENAKTSMVAADETAANQFGGQ